MQKHISSSLLATATMLLLPVAVWAEDVAPQIWQNRLIIPSFEPKPNFHTPQRSSGTFLPPVIEGNVTIQKEDNPVILPARTRIGPTASLTIEPGVRLYAHEYAFIEVFGRLVLNGSDSEPILLTTNEAHPQNQTWSGIIAQNNSSVTAQYIDVQYASPAVSCLGGSRVAISDSRLHRSALGVYTETSSCKHERTRIDGVRKDIIFTNNSNVTEESNVRTQ